MTFSRPGVVFAALMLFLLGTAASAAVIGEMNITSGAGGVIVDADSIDWYDPVGPPNGGFVIGGSRTNPLVSGLFWGPTSSTQVARGTTGTLLDLQLGVPPASAFMTVSGTPIQYFLESVGPGSNNTNCSTAFLTTAGNPNSCSPFAGSPFILTIVPNAASPGGFDTAVSFSVGGSATDGFGPSDWSGAFTTQLSGTTPQAVDATIDSGGSVANTHSGSFIITARAEIPEPATAVLLGTGLLFAGLIGRRRLHR